MPRLIDPETGELIPDALVQQYKLCLTYSVEGTILLSCGCCRLCGECPIYGTKSYARRKIPFCPYFVPNDENNG